MRTLAPSGMPPAMHGSPPQGDTQREREREREFTPFQPHRADAGDSSKLRSRSMRPPRWLLRSAAPRFPVHDCCLTTPQLIRCQRHCHRPRTEGTSKYYPTLTVREPAPDPVLTGREHLEFDCAGGPGCPGCQYLLRWRTRLLPSERAGMPRIRYLLDGRTRYLLHWGAGMDVPDRGGGARVGADLAPPPLHSPASGRLPHSPAPPPRPPPPPAAPRRPPGPSGTRPGPRDAPRLAPEPGGRGPGRGAPRTSPQRGPGRAMPVDTGQSIGVSAGAHKLDEVSCGGAEAEGTAEQGRPRLGEESGD